MQHKELGKASGDPPEIYWAAWEFVIGDQFLWMSKQHFKHANALRRLTTLSMHLTNTHQASIG